MKSLNFEFLRSDWPELASLAGFAEQYALRRSRQRAGEAPLVCRTGRRNRLREVQLSSARRRPGSWSFSREDSFKQAVPRVVVNIIDAIRIHGNKAAHGAEGSTSTVLWLLKESASAWPVAVSDLHRQMPRPDIPTYQEPTPEQVSGKSKAELKREKAAVLQRLAAQEAQMQKLLDDLATARQEADRAKATEEELQARLQAAQTSVSVLDFNEEETRRLLIDTQLAAAGWNVGPGRQSTASVGKEVAGLRPADRERRGLRRLRPVRRASGKPLAVDRGQEDGGQSRRPAAPRRSATPTAWRRNTVSARSSSTPTASTPGSGTMPATGTPRKLYGFYSKDSLQYLIRQRTAAAGTRPRSSPTRRSPAACTRFGRSPRSWSGSRTAAARRCIVQATGTGKTRVAISLSEALIRAGWAKRILFLCDRRELRKQAHNAFKAFLPDEPRVYVTAQTYQEREHRIYLATYPAMMKCFETFDVGFFDLIIADESHRSIYNRYRDLFHYFDALQVGLTATPRKDLITHNTYRPVRLRGQRSHVLLQLRRRHQRRPALPRPLRGRIPTPRRSCATASSTRR